jgi:hypothetical protein
MPRRALNPFEAASALIVEHRRDRSAAENEAWQQFQNFRDQEGDDHISTRYWNTVFCAIAEGTETPPVERTEPITRKRFDATGKVIVDPL